MPACRTDCCTQWRLRCVAPPPALLAATTSWRRFPAPRMRAPRVWAVALLLLAAAAAPAAVDAQFVQQLPVGAANLTEAKGTPAVGDASSGNETAATASASATPNAAAAKADAGVALAPSIAATQSATVAAAAAGDLRSAVDDAVVQLPPKGEAVQPTLLPRSSGAPGEPAAAEATAAPRFASGATAAAALRPEQLASAAAAAGWTPARVQKELTADSSLKFDSQTGRLVYACSFGGHLPHLPDIAAGVATGVAAGGAAGGAATARAASLVPGGLIPPGQDDPAASEDQVFQLHR